MELLIKKNILHVKIRKNNEMISLADKCIINANYEKFKIIGKTQTKIYGK